MKLIAQNIYDHRENDSQTKKPLFFVAIEVLEPDEKIKIHTSFPISAMEESFKIRHFLEETEQRLTQEIKAKNHRNLNEEAKEIAETLKQLPGIEDFFLPDELLQHANLLFESDQKMNYKDFINSQIEHYQCKNSLMLKNDYDFFTALAIAQIESGINDIYDLNPWFQKILWLLIEQKFASGKLVEFEKLIEDSSQGIRALHAMLKEIGISYYDEEEKKIWVISKDKNLHYVVDLV